MRATGSVGLPMVEYVEETFYNLVCEKAKKMLSSCDYEREYDKNGLNKIIPMSNLFYNHEYEFLLRIDQEKYCFLLFKVNEETYISLRGTKCYQHNFKYHSENFKKFESNVEYLTVEYVTLYSSDINQRTHIEYLVEVNKQSIILDVPSISIEMITSNEFTTKQLKIKNISGDLFDNYEDDFKNVDELIINRLRNDSGLVLLYGEPGCGKTYYIRSLIHKLGKDRKFLFIPPNMVDILSSPKFVGFLINREKTTLIIEDAERAIIDRNSNESSSISVSNLLNISDGIMSDFLDVNIIATFNSDKKNIDSALLRDGRLIAEYKFGKLNIDKTNYLLNKLDKNFISDKPMTVAEIYNINNELHRISATNKKIGFIHA